MKKEIQDTILVSVDFTNGKDLSVIKSINKEIDVTKK